MGYTLRAGISTGRIDSDDLGSFEIRDSELEADDYETAAALVDQYGVEWPDGDPGPPESDSDSDSDSDSETEAESDDSDTDSDEFDAEAFVDRTPMGNVIADIESGDYDDHLDEIEAVAQRQGVTNAVDDRRGE